jgi:hypothetical protein
VNIQKEKKEAVCKQMNDRYVKTIYLFKQIKREAKGVDSFDLLIRGENQAIGFLL